jgi:hypothetical protein
MKIDDENSRIEMIESFCLGQMNATELANFEAMQLADPTLVKEIIDYQSVLTMIQKASTESHVLNTLARLEAEEPILSPNTKNLWVSKLKTFVGIGVAASVLFILYASFSVVQLPGSENDLTIVRDIDPTVLSKIQKNAFDHFYAGQSHITEGQFQAAVLDFEAVLETPNLRPYFKQATKWHLIIAELKSGQVAKAKQHYQELNNCNDCVYPVGFLNKSKLWWQIFWANVF